MSFIDLFSIVLPAMFGGFVGWITNSLAVNMLFKEYLGYGGVIKKQYKEFINNIATLIENNLVNHQTLDKELSTEKFYIVVYKWIKTLLMETLPSDYGEKRISGIDDIDKSLKSIEKTLLNLESQFIDPIFKICASRPLKDIISKEHYHYIIKKSVNLVFVKDNSISIDFTKAIALFLSGKKISSFLSEQALSQFIGNCRKLIREIDFEIFKNETEITINKLLKVINIDLVIIKLQEKLSEKRITDFINDSGEMSQKLLSRIIDFIETENGKKALESFIRELVKRAQNLKIKLKDVINPSLYNKFEKFLFKELPYVIDEIVKFMNKNEKEIEKLFNDAIDNQLDKTLLGKLIQLIKNIIKSNLAQKYEVVINIKKAVKKYGRDASSKLTDSFVKYLESNSIGAILTKLIKSDIINYEILTELTIKNISSLRGNSFPIFNNFLDRKLNTLFKIDLTILRQSTIPQMIRKLKEYYFTSDNLRKKLDEVVKPSLRKIYNCSIENLINLNSIHIPLKAELIQKFFIELWENVNNKSISTFMTRIPYKISWKKLLVKSKPIYLNTIFKGIQNDDVYEKLAKFLLSELRKNLKSFLEGNVSTLSKKELEKLTPEEINLIVKEFMGKDLKYINLFGAILGFVVGGLFAGATLYFKLPSWFVWFTPIIYAGTGWLTNIIAIWMLFRPYKPILKCFKGKPIVHGIFVGRKSYFARNISTFVKDKLLSDEMLNEQYHQNSNEIKFFIKKAISQDNFAVIDSLLSKPDILNKISQYILEKVFKVFEQNIVLISEEAVNALRKFLAEDNEVYISDLVKFILNKIIKKDFSLEAAHLLDEKLSSKTLSIIALPLINFLKPFFETLIPILKNRTFY
jgi:uncharacterized membrane protein YheB (UPF0754 family)